MRFRCKVFSFVVLLGIGGTNNLVYAVSLPSASVNPSVKEVMQVGRSLKGVIVDAKTKEPIIGANVFVKGSNIGTATDVNGRYSMNSVPGIGKYTVTISAIGYTSRDIIVTKEEELNVEMEEDSYMLDEAVVVGYGSQRKASVIGAITTIDSKELVTPAGQVSSSLAGRLAGVVAVQRSGEPGKSSDFWVRGIATFGENKNPLVLVDGVERTLDLLDPEDIESFSILKDATATAVYGVRGANGVILVNTRRGKEGKPNVNVKVQMGVLAPTKLPKMADDATWATMYNKAKTSRGYLPVYTDEQIELYRNQSDPYLYPSIDYLDELMEDYTTSERVNLNVTGGGPVARYYVSGAFYNESGLFVSDDSHDWDSKINYKRFNFTSNVDINLHRTTVLKLNLNGVLEMKHQPYNSINTIFSDIMSVSPNVSPLYWPDADEFGNKRYAELQGNIANPYNTLTQAGYNDNWWTKVNAMIALEQDLSELVTQGLKAAVKFSFDSDAWNQILRSGSPHTWYATGRDEIGNLLYNEMNMGSNTLGYTSYANGTRALYIEGQVNYNRTFGNHNLNGLLLYNQREYQEAVGSSIGALPYRSQGLAARVAYSYNDRYFIEGNFGYNGSENFAPGKRFGFFPSVALGWMVSNEPFFLNNVSPSIMDSFKLKVSLGQSGNDQIGGGRRFVYLPTIVGSQGANWGKSNTWTDGVAVGEVANDEVSWETSTKLNVGMETRIFDALRLQVDWFYEKRKGIFVQRKSVPDYAGVSTMPWSNVGEMSNKGIDLTLEYDKTFHNGFFLSLRGTFTYARNKQINDDQPDYIDTYRNRNGQKYNQQYGLVALGLFQSQEEIDNSPSQFGVDYLRPGDIKYKDINGDGVIDTSDEVPIGYSDVPEIVYGAGISMSWKGFDFSLFFQGIGRTTFFLGGSYFPFNYPNSGRTAFLADQADKYFDSDKQNFDAELPLLYAEGWHGSNYVASTWWQRSGAYVRLKNAELGYTLPKNFTRKMLVKSVRFFLAGTNLLTFAPDVKLWDPEIGSTDGRGYPLMKTVNLGLNINL